MKCDNKKVELSLSEGEKIEITIKDLNDIIIAFFDLRDEFSVVRRRLSVVLGCDCNTVVPQIKDCRDTIERIFELLLSVPEDCN
jgi:hypothetical protein